MLYNQDIYQHIAGLIGLEETKPFECVGTRAESRHALIQTVEQYKNAGRVIPDTIASFCNAIKDDTSHTITSYWDSEHCLSTSDEQLLKQACGLIRA